MEFIIVYTVLVILSIILFLTIYHGLYIDIDGKIGRNKMHWEFKKSHYPDDKMVKFFNKNEKIINFFKKILFILTLPISIIIPIYKYHGQLKVPLVISYLSTWALFIYNCFYGTVNPFSYFYLPKHINEDEFILVFDPSLLSFVDFFCI